MKHILVVAGGNALALMASIAWMQHFKRCNATFYYLQKETINGLTEEETSLLHQVGLTLEFKAFPFLNASLDYVICVQQNGLEEAKHFQSQALVFDYHFELHEKKQEAVLAMKQYFERFCKMYLNEYML